MLIGGILAGVIMGIGALGTFFMHYRLCMKKFGGITGDLAGFFLQICELVILFLFMVLCKYS